MADNSHGRRFDPAPDHNKKQAICVLLMIDPPGGIAAGDAARLSILTGKNAAIRIINSKKSNSHEQQPIR